VYKILCDKLEGCGPHVEARGQADMQGHSNLAIYKVCIQSKYILGRPALMGGIYMVQAHSRRHTSDVQGYVDVQRSMK
jgi:hypothetical protein